MRVDTPKEYDEPRDCLAQDWGHFMKYALPETQWVPVPNIGGDVEAFIKEWNLEGIILSGGNDIGSQPQRDETEKRIISYCLKNTLPLFGVCRGLQMLQHYSGGPLKNCDKNIHVAKAHPVSITGSFAKQWGIETEILVNSYHNYGILKGDLCAQLIPFAFSQDGCVEGVSIKDAKALAVMWHPERHKPYREFDLLMIRKLFGYKEVLA